MPDEVETRVDDRSMQPGIDRSGSRSPGRSRQARMRASWTASRELAVAEDQAGGPVQPREPDTEERGEGVVIAFPRPLDECSLVHGRIVGPVGTPTMAVLDRVWRPCRAKGSVADRVLDQGATRCQAG
jgi:hypothetical protein